MKKSGLAAVFALAAIGLFAGAGVVLSASAGAARHSGDRMKDGTVYVAVSPDTGKPLYTSAADAPGIYSWSDGKAYCEDLEAGGHKDWRLPKEDELNKLFKNRVAMGGFNETGSYPAGWYWSSSQDVNGFAWGRRFSDGHRSYGAERTTAASVRCVR